MNRNDSYKKTRIDWIKDIPKHWVLKPFWVIAKQVSTKGFEHLDLLSVYLDKGVVKFSEVEKKRTNLTSDDKSNYQKVEPGYLVMNNQQAWRGSVGISKYKGIVSPAYMIFKITTELDSEYANYLFRDKTMVTNYVLSSKGIGSIQRNLFLPFLKESKVLIPPINEQKKIHEFIKKKLLINKTLKNLETSRIKKLREYRTSLIHNSIIGKVKIYGDLN